MLAYSVRKWWSFVDVMCNNTTDVIMSDFHCDLKDLQWLHSFLYESLMSFGIGRLSRLLYTGQFIDCWCINVKNINKCYCRCSYIRLISRFIQDTKMTMQQYCLRWNNHQPNFISVFSSLLNSESLVDVTLAAEGRHLQAHKVVLSACSSYFQVGVFKAQCLLLVYLHTFFFLQSLFTINPCQHPIVILKDVKFVDLKVMVDFMYYGEVNVSQEQLPHILKTAEMLKIKGGLLKKLDFFDV